MKKCARVKNPCKICLQAVSNKTGLRCKGACKRWAHFSCLNYTPGKIRDIKAGVITITCPCRTCNDVEQKEFITFPPFSCDSSGCPSNVIPKCEIPGCPMNTTKPIPAYDKFGPRTEPKLPTGRLPAGPVPVCTRVPLLNSKHANASTNTDSSIPKLLATNPKYCSDYTDKNTLCRDAVKKVDAEALCELQHSQGVVKKVSCSPQRCNLNTQAQGNDDTMLNKEVKRNNVKDVKEEMCKTCITGGKSSSCSGIPSDISEFNVKVSEMRDTECPKSRSECAMSKESRKALIHTIQQLGSVVGHLSDQVKDLVCRMKAGAQTK